MAQVTIDVKKEAPVIPDDPVVPDDPGAPEDPEVPVVPNPPDGDTNNEQGEIQVPNTGFGLFTNKQTSAYILPIISLVIAVIAVLVVLVRKFKAKSNRSMKLNFKRKKLFGILAGVLLFSTVLSISVLKGINRGEVKATDDNSDGLSVTMEDVNFEVTLSDEKVYLSEASTITVEGGTRFGYNLSIYTEDNALRSETDEIVSVEGNSEQQVALSDNTWGIALTEPDDNESEVWQGIPDEEHALTIKSTGYEVTETGDTATIYYGAFLTPEATEGVYESSAIQCMIVANVVEPEVTAYFDGNGLDFEDGESTNMITYGFIPRGGAVALEGTYAEPENWLGKWYLNLEEDTIWFESEAEIEAYLLENATDLSGKSLTFYAYNSYEIIFDSNGGTGEMDSQTGYTYEGLDLSANEFTRDSFDFSRWNTKADGTGVNYLNEAEVMNLASGGGSIRLYAIWVECGPNKICYDSNGISNLGLNKQSVTSNSSATLLAPNLERAGYGFAGWSTSESGLSDSDAKIYGPNETISTGNLSMEGIKLYAVWVASVGYLQNWGCPDDDVFPVGSVTALTDIRDNNVYTVAKLADSSCWMVENLRLGGATELTLTENETESAGSLPVSVSGWTANSSPVTVKKMNSSNLGSSNTWTSSNNSIIFRYGNYYSWSAAINSNIAVNSGTANTSICPAGWTLPSSGGTKRSYRKLNDAIDGKWTTFPNNFVYSGSYMRGSTAKGENGYYWTTSVYGAESAYMLGISGNSTNYHNMNKNTGGAIRCVHLPIEKTL